MSKYFPPQYKSRAFHCPLCGVYSNQSWMYGTFDGIGDWNLYSSSCSCCREKGYWHRELMIYPHVSSFPPPNRDLGEEILKDYQEASAIAQISSRGASALLRLAIQKLCIQLGEKGKNINDDIGQLVQKGLSPKVQKMLDIVRVVGNNAVHPGQINLEDNPAIVSALANLLNEIADEMITKPRELDELYHTLPSRALEGIKRRDSKNIPEES